MDRRRAPRHTYELDWGLSSGREIDDENEIEIVRYPEIVGTMRPKSCTNGITSLPGFFKRAMEPANTVWNSSINAVQVLTLVPSKRIL